MSSNKNKGKDKGKKGKGKKGKDKGKGKSNTITSTTSTTRTLDDFYKETLERIYKISSKLDTVVKLSTSSRNTSFKTKTHNNNTTAFMSTMYISGHPLLTLHNFEQSKETPFLDLVDYIINNHRDLPKKEVNAILDFIEKEIERGLNQYSSTL